MVFVAEQGAILAYPFRVAVFAVVEICHFCLLPLVGEAECVYLDWNALNLQFLAGYCAYFRLQGEKGAVDDQLVRDLSLNSCVHLGAYVLEEGEDGGKRGDGCQFDGRFEILLVGEDHLDFC